MYPKVRARGMSAYHPSVASSSSQPTHNAVTPATTPAPPPTAPPATAPVTPPAEGAHQPADADEDESKGSLGPGTLADQSEVVDTSQPSSSQTTSSKHKIGTIIKESASSAFPYYCSTSQLQLSLTSTSTHPSKHSQLSLPDSLHHLSQTNKTASAVMGMQGTISQLAKIIQLQMAMPSSAEDRQDLQLDAAM